MFKRLSIFAAVAVAVLSLTACATSSGTVSTLNTPVVTAEANSRGFAQATTAQLNRQWSQRIAQKQDQVKNEADKIKVVLVGDSITHFWENQGRNEYQTYFGKYNPLNLGFAGDQTQHTLHVVKNCDFFKQVQPKLIMVMIGTNNVATNQYSNESVAEGIRLIVASLREQAPKAKIVLFGIFPRGMNANDGNRPKLQAINAIISKFADNKNVFYEDLWDKFLTPDGTLTRQIMADSLHPTAAGYVIWGDAIKPYLERYVD